MGDGLVILERLAERLALERPVGRQLERMAGHPDRKRADAGAKQVERAHRDPESVAGFAKHVVTPDEHVLEAQRADRVRCQERLVLAAQPHAVAGDSERGQPVGALRRAREHRVDVGLGCV